MSAKRPKKPRNRTARCEAATTATEALEGTIAALEPIALALPFGGISVNHAYINRPGRGRVLSSEARQWKEDAQLVLTAGLRPYRAQLSMQRHCLYRVELEFFDDWFTKAGEPRKKDVDNMMKPMLDVLASAMGIDDKRFFEVALAKRVARRASVRILVEPLSQ
jgi:Holliday junction resolvase RusA-like endonuclease